MQGLNMNELLKQKKLAKRVSKREGDTKGQ